MTYLLKDHPSCKSKKQKKKLKKKKSVSRLRYAWNNGVLDNKQDDNADLYYEIEYLLEEITREVDRALEVNSYFNDADIIINAIESIRDIGSTIYDKANSAKDNGISNETQLYIGEDQIRELERYLEELESDLQNIISGNEDLQSEINSIQQKIDSIQEKLDSLSEEVTADSRQGIVHEERTHAFICYAHDAIMSSAEEIISECDIARNNINEALEQTDGNNDEEINDKINDCVIDLESELSLISKHIEDDMSEAKSMNNNMGSGIDKKNERIKGISEGIFKAEDELSDAKNDQDYLKRQLDELKSLLDQLDGELSKL